MASDGDRSEADADARERGRRRYRRAFASALGLAFVRGANFVSTLVLVPVLLGYWGAERFGTWMALASVTAVLSTADFGLGHGLMTAIAAASGDARAAHLRRIVASGMAAMSVIALVALVPGILLAAFAPWPRWLGTEVVPADELSIVVLIVIAGALIGAVSGVAGRVQSGLQAGYLGSAWNAASTFVALGATLVAVHLQSSFVGIVAVWSIVPIVFGLANTLWYFGRVAPDLAPRPRDVEWREARRLFSSGLLFFVLQLAASLAFFTDSFILANRVGAGDVPGFAVPARLFAYVGLAVALVTQPLWPAYAEAFARRDVVWIKRTFVRTLQLALAVSGSASIVLYALRDVVFPLWTRGAIVPDAHVVAALGVWTVVESVGNAFAMLLNGLQIIRAQVAIAIVLVAVSFPLRIAFLEHFGVWGLPLATTVAYAVVGLVPCVWIVRGLFGRMRGA